MTDEWAGHEVITSDDDGCPRCWDTSWPRGHEGCPAGGRWHAKFGDESWDEYWLDYWCDGCGSTDGPE